MKEMAIKAEELVLESLSVYGIITPRVSLEYVNEHMPIEVDISFVEACYDKYFGEDDWSGGCDFSSINHNDKNGENENGY